MNEYKGFKIEVLQDTDPMNPRTEFDNVGTMNCAHKKYQLGDKHPGYRIGEAGSWQAEASAVLDVAVILPVYLYDHSGQTVSTYPFPCPWDSGQVGYIWVTKTKARKEFGWKVLTKARLGKLEEILRNEVKTYDQYLRGEVYGYRVLDKDGDEVDSCWGFYGDDHEASGLLEAVRSFIDYEVNKIELVGVQQELALT